MAGNRIIRTSWKSKPTREGAGVHLKRAFGYQEVPDLDPFLLLDDFRSNDPEKYLAGFPWHPHRGIETITYMLDGSVAHGDSMGNKGVISPGDVQWMTAGSGIIHQEMPKGDKRGRMGGFQLWANLPASHKMMDPRYRGITSEEIPAVRLGSGGTVKVICGAVAGTAGPVRDIVTDPEYLDVSLPGKATFRHAVKKGHTLFAYVIEGRGRFDESGRVMDEGTLVVFEREGTSVEISTDDEPVRLLLVSGKPLGEPVAWYGPIVMNTEEELRTAFDEYQRGTFIKYTAGRRRA
jgi:hypothetical protein